MMNKKQLTISLAILGVLAIVVICIGLFSGTESSNIEYDKELVAQLEQLGKPISSYTKFKDGRYMPIDATNIDVIEKDGDILHVKYNGHSNYGDVYGLGLASSVKKYKGAEVVQVRVVTLLDTTNNNNIVDITEKFKTYKELTEAIKGASIPSENVIVHESKIDIKILNKSDDIHINDIVFERKELKNSKITDEERAKLEEEINKNLEELCVENEEYIEDYNTHLTEENKEVVVQ